MSRKLLYIVVLYGMTLEESLSYKGLSEYLSADELRRDVYVHDNSIHNIYLAGAYNKGLEYAMANGYEWIVLLDEDTMVSAAYLSALKAATAGSARVCVPTLADNGEVISPSRLYGVPVAMNSGMAIRCSVMQEMGGFNKDYPLDYLDYWLCHCLYDRDISLEVLPVQMVHHLSLNSTKGYVSRERYMSLLAGERRYAEEFGYAWRYRLHLIGRLIKWSLTGHTYVKETREALIRK